MMVPDRNATIHRAKLIQLLVAIADDEILSQNLFFKGGTCASMRGLLDRFSVDLDFDINKNSNKKLMRSHLEDIFQKLEMKIQSKSKKELFYVVKYESPSKWRNSIKVSLVTNLVHANSYALYYLSDIDRYMKCQTPETMFANKLVSLTDRYRKYKTIAGRDLYDIHAFFNRELSYNEAVIKERTKKHPKAYFKELIAFITNKITQIVIDQDLNYLLPSSRFQAVRNSLKQEVILFLRSATM